MNKLKATILRIGHRFERDKRISTHIALVGRAFGAQELVLDSKDSRVKEGIDEVNENWGGGFEVRFIENWKSFVEGFDGTKIHLTMYGININDVKFPLGKENVLVIVGGKKVPPQIYGMVDYNIAVGNQPHSEVAALAVFLDRFFEGKELDREFAGKQKIIPQKCGKKVVRY